VRPVGLSFGFDFGFCFVRGGLFVCKERERPAAGNAGKIGPVILAAAAAAAAATLAGAHLRGSGRPLGPLSRAYIIML